MRARFAIAGLSVLLNAVVVGQGQFPTQRASGDVFFSEAIALPGADSATMRIDLHLRIDCAFFVPVRDAQSGGGSVFTRRGEILVELQDSLGLSLDRTIRKIDITDDVSERDLENRKWYQTTITLKAPPGRHQFLIEIDDRESDRKLVDRGRTVIGSPSAVEGGTSWVLLEGNSAQGENGTFWLQNYGGEPLFGHPASLLVRLPPGEAETVDAELSIRIDGEADEEMPSIVTDTLAGVPVRASVVLEAIGEGDRLGYRFSSGGDANSRFIVIPLPTSKLPLRRYALSLTLRDNGTRLPMQMKFRTLWPQMPFSLRDVDMALASLLYIVPEETLDSLRSGDFQTRRHNLEQFWETRDQTPGTIENEVMTQYYRRVDYARKHFGTIRQPDGFRSDRGRIYILHGKPTRTERDLDPQAGFREIWTYSHLGKRFVFEDRAKTGNYVLTATDVQ